MNKVKECFAQNIFSVSSGEGLSQEKMMPGNYPVYGGNGLIGYHSSYLSEKQELIIGRVGEHCGNVHLTEAPSWITDNALIVSFNNNDKILKYWYYILKNINLGKFAFKGAQPVITGGTIDKIIIKYTANKNKQRKIARILTTLDNIIEKTESAIEKYKAIKQGMMHDLFTHGIDLKTGKLRPCFEDAPELYKETELGMVPRGWDVGVLNDYFSNFINGGNPSTKKLTYWQGDIPWITGADFLESFQIGFIRRKITNEAVKNSATHVIPEGNILLVTRTGVGKLAIAPTDIAISQDITGLILVSDKTVINYFYYYFQRLVEGFKKMNQGTSINGIIRDDLISCPICVPTTTEQTMVAAKLLRIDNRLKNEQQYLDKQKKLKQGLMQDLLTGKKEVTPDPEDFNRGY